MFYTGNTALIFAVMVGNDVAVEIIVRSFRRLGLNVDHVNKSGLTALLVAVERGHIECATVLAADGRANTMAVDPRSGLTAEQLAVTSTGCTLRRPFAAAGSSSSSAGLADRRLIDDDDEDFAPERRSRRLASLTELTVSGVGGSGLTALAAAGRPSSAIRYSSCGGGGGGCRDAIDEIDELIDASEMRPENCRHDKSHGKTTVTNESVTRSRRRDDETTATGDDRKDYGSSRMLQMSAIDGCRQQRRTSLPSIRVYFDNSAAAAAAESSEALLQYRVRQAQRQQQIHSDMTVATAAPCHAGASPAADGEQARVAGRIVAHNATADTGSEDADNGKCKETTAICSQVMPGEKHNVTNDGCSGSGMSSINGSRPGELVKVDKALPMDKSPQDGTSKKLNKSVAIRAASSVENGDCAGHDKTSRPDVERDEQANVDASRFADVGRRSTFSSDSSTHEFGCANISPQRPPSGDSISTSCNNGCRERQQGSSASPSPPQRQLSRSDVTSPPDSTILTTVTDVDENCDETDALRANDLATVYRRLPQLNESDL